MNTCHQFNKHDILKRTKSKKPAPKIEVKPAQDAPSAANEETLPNRLLGAPAVKQVEIGLTNQGKSRRDQRALVKMAKIEIAAAADLKHGLSKSRKRSARRRKLEWHRKNGTSKQVTD